MSEYDARATGRCSTCQITAIARYTSNLKYGVLKIRLEHLDDETHNIVPVAADGRRGQSALLVDPDVEQAIAFLEIG